MSTTTTNGRPSGSSGPNGRHRVLVAEDDREMRSLLSLSLKQGGYDVVECRHGTELLDHLKPTSEAGDKSIKLVISDIRMPGLSGLAALASLNHDAGAPPVILITAFGDADTHREARRLGAVAFFDKPFELEDLLSKVRQLVPP